MASSFADENCLALYREVLEVYKLKGHEITTGSQMMDALNAPHRVQDRGFEVLASHLIEAMVAREVTPTEIPFM